MKGLSHIMVFIAGATSSGRRRSQARTMLVSRLSHMPCVSIFQTLNPQPISCRTICLVTQSTLRLCCLEISGSCHLDLWAPPHHRDHAFFCCRQTHLQQAYW